MTRPRREPLPWSSSFSMPILIVMPSPLSHDQPLSDGFISTEGVGLFLRASMPRSMVSMRDRSEEHTSELKSLMRISYVVFCLKKKQKVRSLNLDKHKLIKSNT